MKKTYLATFIAVLFFSAFTSIVEPLPIGSDLPKADLKMVDVSGKQITLKEAQKENGLLVMFSCNTCPVVIGNQERTNDISGFALDNNVGVILLNSNEGSRDGVDSHDAMKVYSAKQGYEWHYAVDKNHELADAFGANRTPECFLFDKNGKLVYHGAIDDNPQDASNVKRTHLKEAINEMKTGKQISVQTSKSIGCAIKRK